MPFLTPLPATPYEVDVRITDRVIEVFFSHNRIASHKRLHGRKGQYSTILVFTPLARSSYKWDKKYAQRTAVERVNSRLDGFFGFENHTIRGLKKMKLQCGLALCVMLTLALGRLRQKRPELMRRLVVAA